MWVAALRSGDYPQSRGHLKDDVGFCCLGVACEVAIANGEELDVEQHGTHLSYYDGAAYVLPDKVRRWLGLRDDEGTFRPPVEDRYNALTELNDAGWSFNMIADFIESDPEGLFEVES